MKKSKFGFTLGEVLVSLAVIGIIMALAAHTIKLAKSSYTAVTFHAFNNINMIVGELKSGERVALNKDKERLPLAQMRCRTSQNGFSTNILAPDYRSYTVPLCREAGVPGGNGGNGVPDTLFCQNTIFFANTKGKTNCEYSDHSNVDFDETINEPKIKINDWNKPNFIATNGYRYYFSKWAFNENVSPIFGFRIIAVDINASNPPNSTDFENEVLPDIVQFLVLDNGEVYPIGVAADNLTVKDKTVTYLNTRVKGYYYKDDKSRTDNVSSSCVYKNPTDGSLTQTCNFAVLYSKNSRGDSFFSYREAFCYSLGGKTPTYVSYCDKYPYEESTNLCPPTTNSKRFDECSIKIVKPVFRYNFK